VISPCVAFNNHPGSTKSFDYVRAHNEAVNALDVMIPREEITADYQPGSVTEVMQHDGSVLRLRKLDADYDATDKLGAMAHVQQRHAEGEIVTGLLYVDHDNQDLNERINLTATPLNALGEAELCPGSEALDKINAGLR
jgi:2-oxoglutarate ferredoxin oxidoreductase subunit beta